MLTGICIGIVIGFVLRMLDEDNERRLGRGRRG